MIKVLVCWEDEEEIDLAIKIKRMIDDLLDEKDLHSGVTRIDDPPKTFALEIKPVDQVVRDRQGLAWLSVNSPHVQEPRR